VRLAVRVNVRVKTSNGTPERVPFELGMAPAVGLEPTTKRVEAIALRELKTELEPPLGHARRRWL